MRCTIAAVLSLPLVLTGCAITPAAPPSPSAGIAISGVVHGGQQPIVGAKVFLFAANTSGYGGSGLAASASNASISLLQSGANTLQDSGSADPTYLDYYTTTGSGGSFSISSDYSCTPGQQVYLYALGGNPTYPSGSANSAIGLLAALGACPSADAFPATNYIVVNEVSTIATAYALAGFATDAVHISSSGTTLAQTGIANAFANVTNLETLSTGVALATTPAGNGTVPQTTIYTLANILASCVNTNSSTSTGCSTLFTNAMNSGSTGTAATDTATAAINIAHNPGSNIAALYALSTATPPFPNALSAQPNDFTLGLSFTGGGLNNPASITIDGAGDAWVANAYPSPYLGNSANGSVSKFSSTGAALSPSAGFTGGGVLTPSAIAIDGAGDAWVANSFPSGVSANGSLSKFSSAGAALSPSTGYTGGGLNGPSSVAIDASGDAWVANQNGTGGLSEFSSGGAPLSPSSGYGLGAGVSDPYSLAIDGTGNVWTVNDDSPGSVGKLSKAGVFLSPSLGYTGGGLEGPYSVAIDGLGEAWIANQYNRISKLSNAGAALSPATGYTGGGLNNPISIAIDGSGSVWIANVNRDLSEFSSAGTALSPATGYTGGGLISPYSIAVDGSGNVWAGNNNGSTMSELIGVATPVITPICAGLPATPTTNGTSNLGTRP